MIPTNENVHVFRGSTDDHGDDEQARTTESDVPSANQVGNRADKGTDGSESQEVGQDKPNPVGDTSNIGIDLVWVLASKTMSRKPGV